MSPSISNFPILQVDVDVTVNIIHSGVYFLVILVREGICTMFVFSLF